MGFSAGQQREMGFLEMQLTAQLINSTGIQHVQLTLSSSQPLSQEKHCYQSARGKVCKVPQTA